MASILFPPTAQPPTTPQRRGIERTKKKPNRTKKYSTIAGIAPLNGHSPSPSPNNTRQPPPPRLVHWGPNRHPRPRPSPHIPNICTLLCSGPFYLRDLGHSVLPGTLVFLLDRITSSSQNFAVHDDEGTPTFVLSFLPLNTKIFVKKCISLCVHLTGNRKDT